MPSSEFDVIPIPVGEDTVIAINFAATDVTVHGLKTRGLKAEFRRRSSSPSVLYTASTDLATILRPNNDDGSVTLLISLPATATAKFPARGISFRIFGLNVSTWVRVPPDWVWPVSRPV